MLSFPIYGRFKHYITPRYQRCQARPPEVICGYLPRALPHCGRFSCAYGKILQ